LVRILLRSGLEIAFSVTILATVVFMLAFALDPRSGDKVAHAWADGLGLKNEAACPTYLGNSFWFSCAGEVRRNGPPVTASDTGRGPPPPQ
jgi:hypothetical protein